VRAGWETKKLGEVIQLEYGKPLADSDRNPNGLYPAYGANGIKDRTDKFYKGEPSIIVGRKGSAGEVTLTEEKYWPLDVTFFVEFARAKYELQYLYFLLLTLNLPSMAKGVKPGINRNDVYDITVTTPDIEEQRRIVTLLDEAFADIATAKANAEKNLQNARELFDSALNAIEGKKEQLGEYIKIKTGKLDANAAVIDGEYPFFTCSREIFAIDTFAFDCEAILLAGNNAVGDFNVKHYSGKFNAYQRTYVISIHDEKILRYRYLYFQMLKSLKKFKEQSVGSSTKFLKLGMIKELEITLPPVHEQDRQLKLLSGLLEKIEDLESIYRQKLTPLDDLKKSLLHQAFSGQL
jgi:type I restriction enzyme S subunit